MSDIFDAFFLTNKIKTFEQCLVSLISWISADNVKSNVNIYIYPPSFFPENFLIAPPQFC